MSGGAYDYAYGRIDRLADEIEAYAGLSRLPTDTVRLRKQFAQHLRDVALAARAIEWVDSGDYGDGDEIPAIKAVL